MSENSRIDDLSNDNEINNISDNNKPLSDTKKHRRWIIPAVCIFLLIGSVTAVAVSGYGTRVIDFFTSRTEQESDYRESGYDLGIDINKIPVSSLKGDVLEVSKFIMDQYASYTAVSSQSPGLWQSDFTSRDEACDYIGLDKLKHFYWNPAEQSTKLNVRGNKQGEILYINLETFYRADNVRIQLFSWIYTEDYKDEITTGVVTTEEVTFNESYYTSVNDKKCHIISSTASESGYHSMEGYIVDNDVLYNLHLAYLAEDTEQAKALMYEWADMF